LTNLIVCVRAHNQDANITAFGSADQRGARRLPREHGRAEGRAAALGEIAGAYGLLQGALWSSGVAQRVLAALAALWILAATWRARRGAGELGAGFSSMRRGWWIVLASAAVSGAMLGAGFAAGTLHGLHGERVPVWHMLLYMVWSWIQEFILQSFIFIRLERAVGSVIAIGAAALLFCLAHVPNPVLLAATFVAGWTFTRSFCRYRNLYALALAHAMLGLALAVSVPDSVTHTMRVGAAYWR
jgi:membrane protease YdiL (CAAX protease family)